MGIRNKTIYIVTAITVLTALMLAFYFLTTNNKNIPLPYAVLSDDGNSIIFTNSLGDIAAQIDISGKAIDAEEIIKLKKGIKLGSDDELMSLAEDYLD